MITEQTLIDARAKLVQVDTLLFEVRALVGKDSEIIRLNASQAAAKGYASAHHIDACLKAIREGATDGG